MGRGQDHQTVDRAGSPCPASGSEFVCNLTRKSKSIIFIIPEDMAVREKGCCAGQRDTQSLVGSAKGRLGGSLT